MHLRRHSKWLTSIAAVGSLLLGAHFVKTTLHLAPSSLLGIEYGDAGDSYFLPFFAQKWALFAPDPPLRDFYVEFKCRDEQGIESPWVSGYGDLLEEHRRHRLTPASYMRRVNRSVTFGVLGAPDPTYDALFASLDNPDPRTLMYIAARETEKKKTSMLGRQNGYRLAWNRCSTVFENLSAVRVRVPSSEVPKFTERNSADKRDFVAHAVPWATWSEIDRIPLDVREIVVTPEDVTEMLKQRKSQA